jgi:glutamate formiminotransferase
VGAREFLIAYNVDIEGRDAEVARGIARRIRESSGGFRFVKAMGLYLESRGCAQVSMNLTNFAETPLDDVYETIRTEAEAHGARVIGGELIGFVPRRAYQMAPRFFEHAANFSAARMIEERIAQLVG